MHTPTSDARSAGGIQARLLGPTGGRALPLAVVFGAAVSMLAWTLLPEAFAAMALLGPLVAGYLHNAGPRAGATAGVATLALAAPLQFALASVSALPSPYPLSVPTDPAGAELALFLAITAGLVALLVALGGALGALGAELGVSGVDREE
ncbi:hypothetical protein L593_05255 [Salinarchaeum sp. Harcht-Bsk1]|uniref:hypothetical protein n=1 Tax=Salinarchaeum sp. Harcht-Bsk1 TaxID=1333523 RepID=UPI0003423F5C|nr:hypothetical protein [Salinarchaeum sp. Harcht-Bsk1]AGN01000.1 hypothetical protein L593_05255 [Salinarchaeum sp. Harcht-Bsk1]